MKRGMFRRSVVIEEAEEERDPFLRTRTQFAQKRAEAGDVQFKKSSLASPHLQRAVDHIINSNIGITLDDIREMHGESVDKLAKQVKSAPLITTNLMDNLAESTIFSILWEREVPIPDGCPKFKRQVINDLMFFIRGEHQGKMWPLRSFIDPRRTLSPITEYSYARQPITMVTAAEKAMGDTFIRHKLMSAEDAKRTRAEFVNSTTACATPSGTFCYNVPFMQALLNFAHLTNLKPTGKKYVSNGGDIPDEYGYAEFIIMHELMHFTQDDFYYQKIIPDAHPKIINYVGDFRSNYELVKAGYSQLPVGLFSEGINYDRQFTYKKMYDIVKREIEQAMEVSEGEGDELEDTLDGMADDHKPGQAEGAKPNPSVDEKIKNGQITEESIDEAGKQAADDVAAGEDLNREEANKENNDGSQSSDQKSDSPGKGKGGDLQIDDTLPVSMNWRALIKKFATSSKPVSEETYSKLSRRNASGLGVLAATGASAVKPGVKMMDTVLLKMAVCMDTSGSMYGMINEMASLISTIMKQRAFAKNNTVVMKFSGDTKVGVVNIAANKGCELDLADILTTKPKWTTTADAVFKKAEGGGTVFSKATADALIVLVKKGFNVLITSDQDLGDGENCANLKRVIQTNPALVFLVLCTQSDAQVVVKKLGFRPVNLACYKQ